MKVQKWWDLLGQDLLGFSKQYPQFAALQGGQFSILTKAASIGIHISMLNGSAKGAEITTVLSGLPGNLPSLDSSHPEASLALMKIYLQHLKRYAEVHAAFWGIEISGAEKVGVYLVQIAENISKKDIPDLEKRIKGDEAPRETKGVKGVALTVTIPVTAPLVGPLSPVSPASLERSQQGIDFYTADLKTIHSYAKVNIQKTLGNFMSIQATYNVAYKKKIALLMAVREDTVVSPELKQVTGELEKYQSELQNLKTQLEYYGLLRHHSAQSNSKQAITDLLLTRRIPLLTEKIMSGIDDGIKNGIEKFLEEKLREPEWVKRILATSEENFGTIKPLLVAELNNALGKVADSKQALASDNLRPLRSAYYRYVEEIIQKIITGVPQYKELDALSGLAVTALLRTVFSNPDIIKRLVDREERATIVATLAARINTAFYNKIGGGKGIYLHGHGSAAPMIGTLFQLPVLSVVLLEKALLVPAAVASSSVSRPQ